MLLVDNSSKPGKKDIGVGDDRELMKNRLINLPVILTRLRVMQG